jgi:hypothetical protein
MLNIRVLGNVSAKERFADAVNTTDEDHEEALPTKGERCVGYVPSTAPPSTRIIRPDERRRNRRGRNV